MAAAAHPPDGQAATDIKPFLAAIDTNLPLFIKDSRQLKAPIPRARHAGPGSSSKPAATAPLPGWLLRTSLTCAWGFANIALLLSNRYLLMQADFQQPVFLTLCHMAMSCALPAALALFRPVPAAALNRRQLAGVAALAAAFSASVVMGNMALRWVHVSFFQAIGATTPAFVAGLALLLLRQRESWGVYAALVPVMVGLVIATGAEPSFHLLGFAATVTATALRALKTVMQGALLKDIEPARMLRHMSCFATLFLLAATVALEGDVLQRLPPAATTMFWAGLGLNCSLALASNFLNILVTKANGALSLQVFGNVFGIVGTVVSVLLFRNPVSLVGMAGYGVTILGVLLYVREKHMTGDGGAAAASRPAKAPSDEESGLARGNL